MKVKDEKPMAIRERRSLQFSFKTAMIKSKGMRNKVQGAENKTKSKN
jgi:hypothetical protein